APRAPAPDASGDQSTVVREVTWQPGTELDPATLAGVDAIVHLAGAGIGDQRWSPARKRELVASRTEGTDTIARAIAGMARMPGGAPRLLSGSAVGYYGDRGPDILTEESDRGEGFLADLCRDWEAATWSAEKAGASVAHVRTGIVLAPHGGALGKVLPMVRAGLGGPLGSGKQYWSWITLHDHVRALSFLLDHPEITGPVNLTGRHPDTQLDVVKALAHDLHRPSLLRAPGIALRVVIGEMASEILGSQRVLPTVLDEAGFTQDHPDLPRAVAWLLDEPAQST
ncbi:MAG: TIGR01777 family oxidoreductase, partial [Ornithinimicrobium sp.]|uniref:TIGR01777 family oxidoreductase n=1 Tax=Ornithinimicrobium sp. TaxID=1977084 RepID=UPI0026E0EEA9